MTNGFHGYKCAQVDQISHYNFFVERVVAFCLSALLLFSTIFCRGRTTTTKIKGHLVALLLRRFFRVSVSHKDLAGLAGLGVRAMPMSVPHCR